DVDAQKAFLRTALAGAGWEVPRLLEHLDDVEDLYLDSISQVRMPTWSRGRVTLVGDAGFSPGAAVGGGTTLAVVSASCSRASSRPPAATTRARSAPTSGGAARGSGPPGAPVRARPRRSCPAPSARSRRVHG